MMGKSKKIKKEKNSVKDNKRYHFEKATEYFLIKTADIMVSDECKEFIMTVLDAFLLIDKDQDGLIDKSDLKKFLDEFLPEEEAPVNAEEFVETLSNQNCKKQLTGINFLSFLEYTIGATKTILTPEQLWTTFKFYDKNGDGHLNLEELGLAPAAENQFYQLKRNSEISEADTDGDGEISFAEFSTLVNRQDFIEVPIDVVNFVKELREKMKI